MGDFFSHHGCWQHRAKAVKDKPATYLTPTDVAKLLMVSPVTVRQWAQKGELKALTTPGGHRRFQYQDVVQFARSRNIALRPPEGSVRRILVVDDDDTFAKLLIRLCHELPDEVVTERAYDGFQAGQKVHSFKPHIILLDLMMPGLNGIDVCHSLKSDPATKSIRIITMTGFATEENVKRALDAGAETCLSKPFDIDELLKALS